MGTGQPGGAYFAFGQEYRRLLASAGIDVELVQTPGSVANARLLKAGELDVAFVQGGALGPTDGNEGLSALCSLFREPLWLFYRAPRPIQYLTELAGQRIAVGQEASGTRAVAMRFIADNGLGADNSPPTFLLNIGGQEAADALKNGEIDVAIFIASIEAPLLHSLLSDPGIRLMSFARSDAYLRRHRFLTQLILPQGSLSLAHNVPDQDKNLLAPAAMLVANNNVHPDLIPLLLDAAKSLHGAGNLVDDTNEFPSDRYLDLPLNKDAKRYLEQGPSWLYRTLPYRLAAQIDRLKILLLPLLSLLLPLFKMAPPVYRWRMRARVFRWYDQLRKADLKLSGSNSASDRAETQALLDRLDAELVKVIVPLSYMREFYDLRVHINYLRQRLEAFDDE